MLAPTYYRFQVNHSGKWLKIRNSATSDSPAAQGSLPTEDNYLWEITAPDKLGYLPVEGYFLIQVKSSGQYLNISEGKKDPDIVASQSPLPGIANPQQAPPDYFLWKIISDPNQNGWCNIQVKSSNLYLNIYRSEQADDAVACQGEFPTESNYLWMQSLDKDPINVLVTLNIKDCPSIYALDNGKKLTDSDANNWLSIQDNNQGATDSSNNQSSFETKLNPGSLVTWQPNIESQDSINSGFQVVITSITYERGSGSNVLGPVTKNNGNVQTQVLWTAMPLANSGDNESYTITFTVDDGTNGPRTYSFDPKIKINPSN